MFLKYAEFLLSSLQVADNPITNNRVLSALDHALKLR